MIERFRNGWSLVKASGHVLMLDRELLVFPFLSGLACVLVSASFFGVGLLTGLQEAFVGEAAGTLASAIGTVVGIVYYLVLYTVIFFFNAALVGAALIRLNGGDPTVGDGFRIATDRIGPIIGYAALAASVGMLLRAISERSAWLGRLVAGIIGTGWTLATFLVVPILVTKEVDPWTAVKESATLFKSTWGEQVAGNFSIGLVFLPIYLVLIALAALGIGLTASVSPVLAVVVGISAVGALVFTVLVSSALSTIYQAALYQYATTGAVPAGFETAGIDRAFVDRG